MISELRIFRSSFKFTKQTQLPIINSASLRIERGTNGILIKP